MTAEMTATYVTAVIGCMARKAVRWLAEVLLWLADLLGVALLVYAAMLAFAPGAAAEEVYHYPVAVVDVNEGSHLNVRRWPGGVICGSLDCFAEVVVLERHEEWGLITTRKHHEVGWKPLGWVHTDYLRFFGVMVTTKKSLWVEPQAGTSPEQYVQDNYTKTAEGLQ